LSAPRAILVEFVARPDCIAAARALILANAETSLREEPGCLRFDVLVASDLPQRFVLYEIYDSAAAFQAHLKTRHFEAFSAATKTMFETRTIRELDLISAERAPARGDDKGGMRNGQ
jgi:quinol monooxygenase YgiN